MVIPPISAQPLFSADKAAGNLGVRAAGAEGAGKTGAASPSFEGVLGREMQNLTNLQQRADSQAVDLATGKDVSLVDSVLTMEQLSLGFKFVMQVRDKAIGAYQDVMRMQM